MPSSTQSSLESLKEEIAARKRHISDLPPCTSTADAIAKAKHQQSLGAKEEEHELRLEEQRIANVVQKHGELHPPANISTDDCPLCLETITSVNVNSVVYFPCCGKCSCKPCYNNVLQQRHKRDGESFGMERCPLCRSDLPKDRITEVQLMKKRANAGQASAQRQMGSYCMNGYGVEEGGCPLDKNEALRWYTLAADQRDACGLYYLGKFYLTGEGVVDPSYSMARAFLKEAADLGHFEAQEQLSLGYYHGDGGGRRDVEKAYFYMRLAYHQSKLDQTGFVKDGKTAYLLGLYHCKDAGLLPSSGRSGKTSFYYFFVACVLFLLFSRWGFRGIVLIPFLLLFAFGYDGRFGRIPDTLLPGDGGTALLNMFFGTSWKPSSSSKKLELLIRAKHYLEEAANRGNSDSYPVLANVLLQLCELRYDGNTTIPGHCVIPQVLYWARKSEAGGNSAANKFIDDIVSDLKEMCNHCGTSGTTSEQPLKACARCSAAWYCGRECQQLHWKAGHKIDCCVKQD